MKNILIFLFLICLIGKLFAQTPTPPNIVSDGSISEMSYSYYPNGQIKSIATHFYIKNIGGSGEINVIVTAGSYTENNIFTFQENSRYEFISEISVSREKSNLTVKISASFQVNPVLILTWTKSPTFGSDFFYYNTIPTRAPTSTLVFKGLITSSENNLFKIPEEFALLQNYPNPFNSITTINYSVPTEIFVTIKIYDVLGKEVTAIVEENKQAGNYKVQFNASKLVSGIYYYRMQADNYITTKKFILLK